MMQLMQLIIQKIIKINNKNIFRNLEINLWNEHDKNLYHYFNKIIVIKSYHSFYLDIIIIHN